MSSEGGDRASSPARHVQWGDKDTEQPLMGHQKASKVSVEGDAHPRKVRKTSSLSERMRKVSSQLSAADPEDENQERGNWSNPVEFLLSSLGYVVGLGNLWRFPYLVYRNGGGAFFIPYLVMLALCGMPLLLMELTVGQYWAQGALTVWRASPLFKGIGFSMLIVCFLVITYYCMITGWAVWFLYSSLRSHLPWACCEAAWATDKCVSFVAESAACNGTTSSEWSSSSKFAADEYFHHSVLGITQGLHDVGGLQWRMILVLGISWLIVAAVLSRGVKSLGKFSYVTSSLPYLVLLTLLVKALMQEGAMDGIRFYFTPTFSRLADARVWSDAATQIFYSSGVCFGGSITMASYNNRHHNVLRDTLFLSTMNFATSVFSGSVVFAILGFMAHSQNTTVAEVATSGPGLVFVAYPQAVTLLSASPVWSTLFFLMLTLLALSTMFPLTENVVSGVRDQFPQLLKDWKFCATMGVCATSFLLGVSLATEGGMFVLTFLDTYAVGKTLLFIGVAEASVFGWVYGSDRLVADLESMIGKTWGLYIYKVLWRFVTPTLLAFAIAFSLAQETPAKYGEYAFPPWAVGLGWATTIAALLPIPLCAAFRTVSLKRAAGCGTSLWECVRRLCQPEEAPGVDDDQATFDPPGKA